MCSTSLECDTVFTYLIDRLASVVDTSWCTQRPSQFYEPSTVSSAITMANLLAIRM